MARIALVSFGKSSSDWARQEFEIYSRRLSAFCEFESVELKESRKSDQASRLKEESDAFQKRFSRPAWKYVVLTEEGRLYKTTEFAKWLEPRLSQNLVFLIGSAYGIDASLKVSADLLWSLSPLTFTHEHARIILVEQVYRAFQVLRGHPYHHV